MTQPVYYPLIKHGFQEKDLYSLPVAGADTLGGVKVGSGLSVDGSGVLSADGGGSLPIASAETLGGVKVGSGLSIDENGVLSADGGGGSTPHIYHCAVLATDPSHVTALTYTAFVFNNLLFINGLFNILDTPSGNFLKVVYDDNESDVFTIQFLESYSYDASLIDVNDNYLMYNIGGFARTNSGYNTLQNDSGSWPTGMASFNAVIPVDINVQS